MQRSLEQLKAAGYSDQVIADTLGRDVAAGKVAGIRKSANSSVSRATIGRIRIANDDRLASIRSPQMKAIYCFLQQSAELRTELYSDGKPIRSSHEYAPLLDVFQRAMRAKDGPLSIEKLKSLVGTYYLYRKAWTSQNVESYIRCILRFEWIGEALFYSEEQNIFDTVSGTRTEETDQGIVIPFSMNVILLGRGDELDVLKFFSFHDFTPFPDGRQPVQRMTGNYITVYAKGPHPSFGAYVRRVEADEGEPACAFYAPGELDSEIVERIAQASKPSLG